MMNEGSFEGCYIKSRLWQAALFAHESCPYALIKLHFTLRGEKKCGSYVCEHSITQRLVKSLCGIPETNIVVYQLQKFQKKEKIVGSKGKN